MGDWKAMATKAIALVIGLRALLNFGKPFGGGLVFFGKILRGAPNLILAPSLGIYMLVLVYGMWAMRRFALPMSAAYSIFVVFNIFLFPMFQAIPGGWGMGAYAVFGAVGIGGGLAGTWLLYAQRARLT